MCKTSKTCIDDMQIFWGVCARFGHDLRTCQFHMLTQSKPCSSPAQSMRYFRACPELRMAKHSPCIASKLPKTAWTSSKWFDINWWKYKHETRFRDVSCKLRGVDPPTKINKERVENVAETRYSTTIPARDPEQFYRTRMYKDLWTISIIVP